MAPSNHKEVTKSNRLVSLDAFRGITMILLISHGFGLTNLEDVKFWNILAVQFSHAQWEGMRFWDLVQPFFIFIVGVAMPYSFTKRRRMGQSYREIFGHAVRRSLILIFLGVVVIKGHSLMEGTPSLTNVLTQIGFT
jgi:predicted acyltransferase